MDNIFIYNFVLLVYNEGNNIWREEMNEYPVVAVEDKKEEQLSVYCNYKADVSYIFIRAVIMSLFIFFFIRLICSVVVDTPYFTHHFNQILAKYEYIKEGVSISYMMKSVDFIYGIVVDYILLVLLFFDVLWCALDIIFKLSFSVQRKKPLTSDVALKFVGVKRKLGLFFLRWNIVSVIVIAILYISKIIIF